MITIQPFAGLFSSPVLLLSLSSTDFFWFIIVCIFSGFTYGVMKASARSIKVVHGHWHHMFETIPFTSSEFYTALEKEINEKGIEGITFLTVTHSEGGLLSANRQYLRVRFREYMMDICAAPFAKEAFFVSWWLGEAGFQLREVLISLPVIGKLFTKREKTFYEQDTEIMFKEITARCIKKTIEGLVEVKGVRQLETIDWREKNPKPIRA